MAITIGGKTPQLIEIDGKAVQSLAIGGEVVWSSEPDYFYIENAYNGQNTVTLKKNGSPTTGTTLEYSADKSTWIPTVYDANGECQISLQNQNEKVYFRSSDSLSESASNYYNFTASQSHSAGGDLRTLIDYTDATLNTAQDWCFVKLFQNNTFINNVLNLDFAKISVLATRCYQYMLDGCTALTSAPALPATTLALGCYVSMFSGCTALTSAPALPATTLANYCYASMFSGCTALTSATALPATTLANRCYSSMFYNCTALTSAPALPATTLAEGCYDQMFYNCTALTSAPALPATTLAKNCYRHMFDHCTALTSAPALPATTLAEGCYDGMFYIALQLINVPALPATTMEELNCYRDMFYNCGNLRRIDTYISNWNINNSTDWVNHVHLTGDFYNLGGATIPTGTNGIPSGWTEHTSL